MGLLIVFMSSRFELTALGVLAGLGIPVAIIGIPMILEKIWKKIKARDFRNFYRDEILFDYPNREERKMNKVVIHHLNRSLPVFEIFKREGCWKCKDLILNSNDHMKCNECGSLVCDCGFCSWNCKNAYKLTKDKEKIVYDFMSLPEDDIVKKRIRVIVGARVKRYCSVENVDEETAYKRFWDSFDTDRRSYIYDLEQKKRKEEEAREEEQKRLEKLKKEELERQEKLRQQALEERKKRIRAYAKDVWEEKRALPNDRLLAEEILYEKLSPEQQEKLRLLQVKVIACYQVPSNMKSLEFCIVAHFQNGYFWEYIPDDIKNQILVIKMNYWDVKDFE